MRAINEEKTKELMQELLPDDPQETLKILEEFDVLMMRYDSAIREVRTKLEILNDELSAGRTEPNFFGIVKKKKTVQHFGKIKATGRRHFFRIDSRES